MRSRVRRASPTPAAPGGRLRVGEEIIDAKWPPGLDIMDVDSRSLDYGPKILTCIIRISGRGRGRGIAAACQEVRTIEDIYEPYLIRQFKTHAPGPWSAGL